MFNNYLKVAVRNLLKQKSFTFINVAGLAIGMTCFILILLYVRFELSYDTFHEKADQIYRVVIERTYPDKIRNWGRTAYPIAKTFTDEYPEVVAGTRLGANNNLVMITYGENNIEGNQIVFADPNFFDVFTVPMLHGDPKTALAKPNMAVISQETAQKLFGEQDAIGKTVTLNNTDFTISGVSENMPANSHFHYDFLLSLMTLPVFDGQQWINNWGAFTYIVLREGANGRALESKLADMIGKYMAPEVEAEVKTSFEDFVAAGNGYKFSLQRLKDIHLRSRLEQEIEPTGNITYIYLFTAISIFVLLIACINFMNLSTARSASRAREVGVRKTLGSGRGELVAQFIFESTMLSGLALIVAMVLVWLFLPQFNVIADKQLEINYFDGSSILPLLIGFSILVGFLAGSYPAFFLSSFRPAAVLKGKLQRGAKNSRFRNTLVIFQFAVSIILIVGAVVVSKQIDFMLSKELGFDKEHVIVIKNAQNLNQQFKAFKQDLLARSDVVSVSGSFNFPAGAFDGNTHKPEGTLDDRAISMSMIFADYDYVETMGMDLIAGRNFSEAFSTDPGSYVLNETAVRVLGLADPVGARITDNTRTFTVIGVLKDFHFKSLHNEISPLIYVGNQGEFANFVSVRIRPENMTQTLSGIEKKWRDFTAGQPFSYSFLDEEIAAQYAAEKETKQIFEIFSILAVFIGCLGLFGLAAFTAEQRTKEIGVRKVMGASIWSIVLLLVREFTRLVSLAYIIATPVAYLAMSQWLQTFAYSINLTLGSFLFAGALALGIALLTVSYQAVKAALPNPVKSLRYE